MNESPRKWIAFTERHPTISDYPVWIACHHYGTTITPVCTPTDLLKRLMEHVGTHWTWLIETDIPTLPTLPPEKVESTSEQRDEEAFFEWDKNHFDSAKLCERHSSFLAGRKTKTKEIAELVSRTYASIPNGMEPGYLAVSRTDWHALRRAVGLE
jgi:hypothetical protein